MCLPVLSTELQLGFEKPDTSHWEEWFRHAPEFTFSPHWNVVGTTDSLVPRLLSAKNGKESLVNRVFRTGSEWHARNVYLVTCN